MLVVDMQESVKKAKDKYKYISHYFVQYRNEITLHGIFCDGVDGRGPVHTVENLE